LVDEQLGAGLLGTSNAPVLIPSRGFFGVVTSKIALRPSAGVVFAHRHYRLAPVVTMRVGAGTHTLNDDCGSRIVGANGGTIAMAGRERNNTKCHLVI
jgi:hypothetical protein